MKNLELRRGKVAIMSVAICILMFSLLFSTNIPEYSERANLDRTALLHKQESGEETTHPRSANTHLPIMIDGNAELAEFCTVGNGTESDPYIIENLEINATLADGISIQNTDAHLIIRNCNIVDGNPNRYGINLYNCTEIVISNNELMNNEYGIYLRSSSNNTISGNNCSANNEYGINLMYSSSNNIISGNNCSANNEHGIQIYRSNNNTISGNTCSANVGGCTGITQNKKWEFQIVPTHVGVYR